MEECRWCGAFFNLDDFPTYSGMLYALEDHIKNCDKRPEKYKNLKEGMTEEIKILQMKINCLKEEMLNFKEGMFYSPAQYNLVIERIKSILEVK